MTVSDSDLITAAINAAKFTYSPYSHYPVGAALLAQNGTIYGGCNIENAAFPAGICAERVALVKAVSEGIRDFSAIVVATKNGGSPCGICRQMLYEFAPNLRVILATMDGVITHDMPLTAMLPLGFNYESLDAPS
jgi:cytidine deaminase